MHRKKSRFWLHYWRLMPHRTIITYDLMTGPCCRRCLKPARIARHVLVIAPRQLRGGVWE
jgi:hypothetical protein